MRPPHEVLGIPVDSSKEEIKKAYRKCALKHHPDKEGGDEDKFKEVAAAYEIMKNDSKKNQFYRTVRTPRTSHMQQEMYNNVYQTVNDIIFNNSSIFTEMFMQKRTKSRKGSDVSINIILTIQEINNGCSKEIIYIKDDKCIDCNGKGGSSYTCPSCKGRGNRNVNSKTIFGSFFSQEKCLGCNGEGYIISSLCDICSGEGINVSSTMIEDIIVPKGTTKLIRVKNAGNCVKNGISGDLLINIKIEDGFNIDGNDILYELYLSIAEACIGCKIEIPTVNSKAVITIPPKTQVGKVFRLKGKGLTVNYHTGDMLITCTIHIPETLSQDEECLMQEILKYDYFKK